MSEFPTNAKVVVIGAGIVGNCLVGHLARLGWTDLVLIEKGPLPNPGGSTGHASNFIFPVDHNKEMALLGEQSADQYRDMNLSVDSGGIEVARTQERMDELDRRMTSAKAWGIEAHLLSPAEVKELVPFINEEVILGGFYCPTVSVVDSLETGTVMRKEAIETAGCQVFANTEVLDIETIQGDGGITTVSAVVTDKGRIEAEYVVVACGVWSNRIANMAGATIPLVPTVHQMADVGPMDILAETNNEIGYPIVRDMDTFCYERQSSGSMEVGSYGHRAILHHPDEIPSNQEAALSPTEMPFTPDDFDDQMETAIELMDMLGDAEIKYAINGLLSLTPDGMPCLGETTEVRNLWSAAAVWVKEGPGMAQVVAEWMTYGYPRVIDAHGADLARFYEGERSDEHIWSRADESFIKTYGIVHPAEQWEGRRNIDVGPYFSRQEDLEAMFFQARTWERPQWYGANADLVERYDLSERTVEWDNRWWSPITVGEHLNLRENCGLVDLSAFQIYELEGPGAVQYADYLAVNKVDVAVGRSIYTPWLTPDGGFHSDLTMMRTAQDKVRIVTGVFDGGRDSFWVNRHMPLDGSVKFTNITKQVTTLGLWGPNAPTVLGQLTNADLSQNGSPYGSVIDVEIAGLPCTLFRVSYVGDTGWEIYTNWTNGPALWDALMAAGADQGIRPTGGGVYGSSGRLEKGYRLMGSELESEYNPLEAGLARPKVKAADFIGKEAYLAAREGTTEVAMCTLTVEDQTDSQGHQRFMQGGNEPILTLDGGRIVDSHGRASRVTSAGFGPSVGKHLLMAYLPTELAAPGTDLQVMYMNELFPVKVGSTGAIFDPENTRLKS
ncbi:MAG: FAD-dependent oxidoreductase [Actinobacteria bacterium]|jgi:glycine cleavage system aminomethyltransferase T/glycine/D-amino acid oxidase-like deaminating enzyme|nr:FAD-dependent oxidoreductase [Actinomycetota bacterium]MBT3747224.1 FAD-dependent oxidoreductase [Actinomycetota bacterium]MBT3970286.1 FAD-dependent oxidoreductase [Actinomycetota bacterium]MBT4009964.1 FAD-dependent oxidoreductase [Actinomycetota bacterium]MBT4303593.1 FAD-dependent oxidoreductase [Actinomycetota bacterium]